MLSCETVMKPISPLATYQSVVNLGRGVFVALCDACSPELEFRTMPESPMLPSSGPLPVPTTPDEARLMLKQEAFEAPDVQTVRMATVEFTSLCPRTRQPDYGSVSVEYVPDGLCLESKSVKYYLWSYRNEGEFCEGLAARIADDVVFAIAPRFLQVEVSQAVRGGIGIVARAVRGTPPGSGC